MCDYLTTRKSGIVLRRYANDIVKEVFRKVIHLCAVFIPFLLKYFYCKVFLGQARYPETSRFFRQSRCYF